MKNFNKIILLALAALFLVSCASGSGYYDRIIKDGKYDTEFPFYNASDELESISGSIRIVNCLAFYRRLKFTGSAGITMSNIHTVDLEQKSVYAETFNKSSSGTATIVSKNFGKAVLLTSAHVIDFPDTLYSFYGDSSGNKTTALEGVAIKVSQSIYSSFPGGSELEILMKDLETDVALVGANIRNAPPLSIESYQFKLGDSDELTWGTFVYIFSFPIHNKMITKGIVSKPSTDDPKFFLVDAVMNRGSSGGIVLAVRDGVPNFELVGIVSWMFSENRNILVPKSLTNDRQYLLDSRYEGNIYVGDIENVKYGITKAVTIEKIKESIKAASEEINRKGYPVPFGLADD